MAYVFPINLLLQLPISKRCSEQDSERFLLIIPVADVLK